MESPSTFRTAIVDMLNRGQKIQAVKEAKDFYSIGLKEAKDLVDSISPPLGGVLAKREVMEAAADRECDLYESSAGSAWSQPLRTLRIEKKASDVTILAEALAESIWARLEERLAVAIEEAVAWDIQQLRNDLTVVAREVQDVAHNVKQGSAWSQPLRPLR